MPGASDRRGPQDGTGRAGGGIPSGLGVLLDLVPDAFLGVSEDGVIAFANTQAEVLFGYPLEELLGRPLEALLPERLAGAHRSHRAAYFDDPRPRTIGGTQPLAGRRRDGSEVPVAVSLSSLELGGALYATAAIRDMTEPVALARARDRLRDEVERERAISSRQNATRLESLVLAAGGIAHDFNNLLAVIINYSAFVSEDLRDAVGPLGTDKLASIRSDVEQVGFAAERAAHLTQQLLAFARNQSVRPEVVRINDAVNAVTRLLGRTLGDAVELRCQLEQRLRPVLIDPGQLEQILVNLLVNACDAMPGGGVLRIETANVEAEALDPDGRDASHQVQVRVHDSGVGMEQEVAERAFEPFFTTKRSGKGSGLGLATVHGIVRQAGGQTHIDSEPGIGTTVTLLLPATDRSRVAPSPPVEVTPAHGGGTILLAEDEPALREITRRRLADGGYEVLTAGDGQGALAAARLHVGDIELLLTDMAMPDMPGPELAARLHSEYPGARVMFMSDSPEAPAGVDVRGGDRVLISKPFSGTSLLAKVRHVMAATEAGPGGAERGA